MKLNSIISLNFKKFKKHKGKALFLILPIAFLVMLSVLVGSEVGNIKTAVQQSVFGTMEEQGTLIKLTKGIQIPGGGDFRMKMGEDDVDFTEYDLENIKLLENVTDTSFLSSLPINQVKTSDLYTDTEITLSGLSALNENFSALYTTDDFVYQEGEPIPIILSAHSFQEIYEDWNGETEISLSFSKETFRGQEAREAIESTSPLKTRALSYEKQDLIGREITLEIGGLEDIVTFKTEASFEGITFKKLSDEELNNKEAVKKASISEYWDYEKINSPITYNAKVVGIIEEENSFANFIPEEFATKLMTDYFQNQLDTRTDKEIETEKLNDIFTGEIYDGTELISSTFSFGGLKSMGIRLGSGGLGQDQENEEETETYRIPGLVVETEREEGVSYGPFYSGGEVKGIYTGANVYEEAVKTSDTVLIKVDNIFNRSDVVSALNKAGYNYQDVSNAEVIDELKTTLNWVSALMIIAFIVLSIIIIIFTMSKFVSEGKKEIGIFRALGTTKNEIKRMFTVQGLLYTIIGYLIGTAFGIASILAIANPLKNWFDSFIEKTVAESYSIVQTVGVDVFQVIDFKTIGIYTGILFVITIIVTLIPATHASRIDPVEAIRNE